MSTATLLKVAWLVCSLVSVAASGTTLGMTRARLRDLRAATIYLPQGPLALYLRWARTRASVLFGMQSGAFLITLWGIYTPDPTQAPISLYGAAVAVFLIALQGGLTYITVREPLVHAQIERALAAAWLAAPHSRRAEDAALEDTA